MTSIISQLGLQIERRKATKEDLKKGVTLFTPDGKRCKLICPPSDKSSCMWTIKTDDENESGPRFRRTIGVVDESYIEDYFIVTNIKSDIKRAVLDYFDLP